MSAAARSLAQQQQQQQQQHSADGVSTAAAAETAAKGDLRDLVTNSRIRKHAFVLFFVW